jgi:hypothetical protein
MFMLPKQFFSFTLLSLITVHFALAGVIEGRVFDEINNEPIIGATIVIQGTSIGTTTDLDGNFKLDNLSPGLYNIQISYLGYQTKTIFELQVTNAVPVRLNIGMSESAVTLETVEVKASVFKKTSETPVSLNSIGVNEIQRSPGGNRDISRVVQLLPGVATGSSFRNDLLIRGGAPSENRFYLDEIEVPAINHFTTQGATGGSNGLINVDFISNVDFYSGAFPSNRGNTMSSVFEFTQRDSRTDRIGFTATVGASDIGLTLEGPLTKSKKTTFLLSARRSYLQLLFKALGLPFLPTYNDFQLKTVHKFNSKNDLTFIGLGAIDDFQLNLDRNETDDELFLLGSLPYFDQWNYTLGARYRHFTSNGTIKVIASRSMLGNGLFKFLNNENDNPAAKLFDLNSTEAENKIRVEHSLRKAGFKINYGINYEYARYTNSTFRRVIVSEGIPPIEYDSKLKMQKYGFFGQVSRSFIKEKLTLSAGLRADGNNYSSNMSNPLKQLSPRISISYEILPAFTVSANTGIYYQLPVYTLLGYRDAEGTLLNQDNLKYIRSNHLVGGFAYTTSTNTKISVEGFYKGYNNYPMLLLKGISFANEGGDYGVVGDEPADASSEGKSYGVELLVQQKLYKQFFGIMSYTWYRSLFSDTTGTLAPASWDNRHILNMAVGYKFKKNWELGVRWVLRGGAPFTPYALELSSLKSVWDAKGRGQLDYSLLNTERLKPYSQMDIRVDKKWFFKKWNLNLYLDIANLYASQQNLPPNLTVERDANGQPLPDPQDPLRYRLKTINGDSGTLLPTIGIVVSM